MDDTISRLAVIQIIEKMRARIGHNLERAVGGAMIEILDEVGEDVGKLPSALGTNLAEVGTDCISREQAIDALNSVDEYNARSVKAIKELPSAQPETHDKRMETHSCDCISRKEAIDDAHAMPDFEKVEKVIIDNLYIGDKKVTDLIASGRLRLVGFCKECKHCFPPLVCKVDGEVVQVTSDRCSIWNGYVEKNGWCYKFEMRTDMRGEQDE